MIVHALLRLNNMEYLLFYSFVTAGLCIQTPKKLQGESKCWVVTTSKHFLLYIHIH